MEHVVTKGLVSPNISTQICLQGIRLANSPSVGHYVYKDVMARVKLCVSIAQMLTISHFLSVPTVGTCSLCFKKEKIKEYGVMTIPVLLNMHDVRLKRVSLQA